MIETNFKHTDIGLIPHDWEVKTLEKVAQTSSGGTPSRSVPAYFSGDIRWFTTGELCDGILYDSIEHITPSALAASSAKLFKEGTLLMAMYGATIGKLGILSKPSTTNQACCAILCNDASTEYLFYQLFFHREAIIAMGRGAGQPNISQDIVKRLPIALPRTIAEQERIAEALSSIDSLISSLGEQIEKKRLIKQGTMQQLLTGKKRLKGFTQPWVEKTMGEIGYTYSGLSGKKSSDFDDGNAQYITFLNILNNPIIDTTIFERVKVADTEKQNKVCKNDLFFNTSSETPEEVGICAVLDDDIDDLYLNSFCFGFRITDEKVSGKYLAYFWRSKQGRVIMTALAQGATRYNLSKVYFNAAKMILPPSLDEQTAIIDILSSMDTEISALEHKREKYTAIRNGMMQQLLTGKIRLI